MPLLKRTAAECLGTFWLVFAGCGSAVLAAKFPVTGIGYLGVSLAFGFAVATGMYALGAVSGGHFNPAVTFGLAAAGRFPKSEIIAYWLAQVVGAIAAAFILYLVASGAPGFDLAANGFAANGFGAHSPGHYTLLACLLLEVVNTVFFVMVVLGATDGPAFKGFAALPVGLALAAVHLIAIPVTNTSVNPARSTGPAIFAGGAALGQLWLFWLAPLVGGLLAGLLYPLVARSAAEPRDVAARESPAQAAAAGAAASRRLPSGA